MPSPHDTDLFDKFSKHRMDGTANQFEDRIPEARTVSRFILAGLAILGIVLLVLVLS